MIQKLVILGATSGIAIEVGRLFAKDGCSLLLVGRDADRLKIVRKDLETRGAAQVETLTSDLSETDAHSSLLSKIEKKLPDYDSVLLAYGTLGDQEKGESEFEVAQQELQTNFVSATSLLSRIANQFEEKKRGLIAVISSVAGDRGRKSNYIYGSAKGALSLFLQGLRNRLHDSGVHVLTIKPGFVDTPMTEHLKKGPLFASADKVAQGIVSAMRKRRDVVYLPWFWRFIMLIIKLIPEPVFKRMSI